MSKAYRILAVLLLTFGLFVSAGETTQALAKKSKKTSWFKKASRKIKRNIKKSAKKTRRAIVKAGSSATNAVMDSAVKAKSKITGKKAKKTWVKGHYKKGNKKHTKGHFRKVSKKGKKKSSGSSGYASNQPLPPANDPVLPNF
jgi:flagellar hook-basal body complex protein FliE